MMRAYASLAGLLILFASVIGAEATPANGSCVGYQFPLGSDGEISANTPVRTLRHDTVVYQASSRNNQLAALEFGSRLLPVKVSSPRSMIQVREIGNPEPLGWVSEHDLLCSFKPLLNNKGLERKVFIKTPPSTEKSFTKVDTYTSYDEAICKRKGPCQSLSRFELYFIFSEDPDNKRFLVSDVFNLAVDPAPPLVGWVDESRVIPWNTTLGMRPKEHVEQVKANRSLTNGAGDKEGIVLAGGKIWHTFPIHIPILDLENDHYHVAAASVGMEGFRPLETDAFVNLKRADVFFLLDGTRSMKPYINATVKVAQNIASELRKGGYEETSLRFGFLVYRDTYADNLIDACEGGICEGLALPSTTCNADRRTAQESWVEFIDGLSKVKETREDADDYPEKLFDGLRQAIQDMASCDQRGKLLFVIGDHGDRENHPPEDIIANFKNNFGKRLIAFIQPPKDPAKSHKSDYQDAYSSFTTQAWRIISKTVPAEFRGQEIEREDFLMSLNEAQIPNRVLELVKPFYRTDIVNEIEQALRGGDSLKSILDKYMREGDMPVLYWQWVENSLCEGLGKQCEARVDHRVTDFYIPVNKDNFQEEIWMKEHDLEQWLHLLRPFEDLAILSVDQQRNEFSRLLKEQVQSILGGPPLDDNEPLINQLRNLARRKNALPVRDQSPLLQYSIREIKEEIQPCELFRLLAWINNIRAILTKVSGSPTLKVSFDLDYSGGSDCPLSEKGKRVPTMTLLPPEQLGPDDTYSYRHSFRNTRIYWLPINFLP